MLALHALQKALGEPNAFSQQGAVRVESNSHFSTFLHISPVVTSF